LNQVRSIEYMTQPVLFEGLQFGRCGVTDIDISCDFQGNMFIFTELKFIGTGLTRGQQYHLEGLVDGLKKGGKDAIAILARHSTPKTDPIIAAEALVAAVYMGDQWERLDENQTLKQYMTLLHNAYQEART
jgi:hypothetical protein